MSQNTQVDGVELKYGDAVITFYRFNFVGIQWEQRAMEASILHAHTHYEIHVVTKGATAVTTDNQSIPLSSGELLILPPGTEHDSLTLREDFRFLALSVKLENVPGQKGFYQYFSSALNSAALQPVKISERLLETIQDWNACSGAGVGDYCRQKALLCDIVWMLFRDIDGFQVDGEPARCSRSRSEILTLLDNLVDNNNYTLTDIAEAIDYSPRNVSRLIRSTYHMSLKELRMKYSLEMAKKLLGKEELTMDQIAVRSHFKSVSAMRGAFRKYLQTTPAEYRDNLIRRKDHDTATVDRH